MAKCFKHHSEQSKRIESRWIDSRSGSFCHPRPCGWGFEKEMPSENGKGWWAGNKLVYEDVPYEAVGWHPKWMTTW